MYYVALLKYLGFALQNNQRILVPNGLFYNDYAFWEQIKVPEIALLKGFIRKGPIIDASILNKNNFHIVFDYWKFEF
jgi:hypothetical protein